MTDAKRKAKILLLQHNMTFADLSRESGYALATIHNVLDGKSSSAKSKQAITNILQAEIFPGITPRPAFTFPAGTEMECLTMAEAQEQAALLGDRVTVHGKRITFVKDTQFVRLDVGPAANTSARRAVKRTPNRQKTSASKSAAAR